MSETTVPNAGEQGGNSTGETPTGDDGFKPITTREEMNAFLSDRVARAEKKAVEKFADYDQLKAAADELAQIKESQKTEAEKAAERLAQAEKRAQLAEQEALRSRIQASHGISDSDAQLFLTGADEQTLTKQAEALAARTSTAGKAPVIPQLGGSAQPPASTADQFAKALESALGG